MMKNFFEELMVGKDAFDVIGTDRKVMVTRRNVANGIDILYGVDEYHAEGVDWRLKDPDVLGYVVGFGSDARVYGLRYPYSLYAEKETDGAIRAFFGGSLEQAGKSLKYAISAVLVSQLAAEYAEGRCVSVEKLAEYRKEAEESERLLDAVISGNRPYPEMVDVDVTTGDILQSIVDALHGSRETIDRLTGSFTASGWYKTQQEAYAYRRVLGEAYDARIAAATPEDKLAQSVAAAFSAAKEKGAKSVVIEILGRDENIAPYVRHNYPDFKVEGQVVRGKYETDVLPRFSADRFGSSYRFTPDRPLKERYGNRNVSFLDDLYYKDVVRISYKGKKLYENPALAAKETPAV